MPRKLQVAVSFCVLVLCSSCVCVAVSCGVLISTHICGVLIPTHICGFLIATHICGVLISTHICGVLISTHICGVLISTHICGFLIATHICGVLISTHICGVLISTHICGAQIDSRLRCAHIDSHLQCAHINSQIFVVCSYRLACTCAVCPAGGVPVVDAVVLTSVWAVAVLRSLSLVSVCHLLKSVWCLSARVRVAYFKYDIYRVRGDRGAAKSLTIIADTVAAVSALLLASVHRHTQCCSA